MAKLTKFILLLSIFCANPLAEGREQRRELGNGTYRVTSQILLDSPPAVTEALCDPGDILIAQSCATAQPEAERLAEVFQSRPFPRAYHGVLLEPLDAPATLGPEERQGAHCQAILLHPELGLRVETTATCQKK